MSIEDQIRQFVSYHMMGKPSNKARLLANSSHMAIAVAQKQNA